MHTSCACPCSQPPALPPPPAPAPRSLVLVPHGGEECCSVEAAFTSYVDPRRCGPRLNLLVQVGCLGRPGAHAHGPNAKWLEDLALEM